jgi:predicted MFS family arabinose efflux permease
LSAAVDARDALPSAGHAALVGLVGLAAAMGIGRFAFTPMLPLMQAAGSIGLAQGAWLAGANYLGYLVGALACTLFAPAPLHAARYGLLAVALLTLAMGVTGSVPLWLVLRFGAGAASACVLVGVSAWSLATLASLGRADRAGVVFAGVGTGIALAGLTGLGAGVLQLAPALTWGLLGAAAAAAAGWVWRALPPGGGSAARSTGARPPIGAAGWRLVFCYGGFGFGYIIPATFLPALARERVGDPALFGWVWPAFGLAAALSTLVAASVFRQAPPRRLWAVAQAVMAAGLLLAALRPTLAALLACAVCVGGTFMVMTMAGLQEARRIAGAHAPRLMAAMTAAFAAGQLAGPFTIGLFDRTHDAAMTGPHLLAAALLLAGAVALWPDAAGGAPSPARSSR